MASVYLRIPRYNVGNTSAFRNHLTGEIEFVKIDHGQSFQEVHETGASLLQRITRHLDDFHYPQGMDISPQKIFLLWGCTKSKIATQVLKFDLENYWTKDEYIEIFATFRRNFISEICRSVL